jgi:hypothetical protein
LEEIKQIIQKEIANQSDFTGKRGGGFEEMKV